MRGLLPTALVSMVVTQYIIEVIITINSKVRINMASFCSTQGINV